MNKRKIQKYYEDNSSVEEMIEVENFLANIKAGTSDDIMLKEFLDELDVVKNEVIVDRAFNNFETRVNNKGKSGKRGVLKSLTNIYKYAAAILFIPLIITAINLFHESNTPKEWIEEYVPYGSTKQVMLSDNSKIWLNSGSKLIYPAKFNNTIRQVYVVGEAYAEIEKDKSRPFVMSAGEVSVEVLGTKFNVKSYSEDEQIAVSLMEGSIRLNSRFKGKSKSQILKPGEIVKFNKKSGKLDKGKFIVTNRNVWYRGKGLYFIDESLEQIVKELERNFDVKIVIENEKLRSERYYSIFVNNETLEEILSALNANNKMKIKHKSDIYYLY